MFTGLGHWIAGIVLSLGAVAGLFIAKGGTHDAYLFGLGLSFLCLVAVGFVVRGALQTEQ
jgi:hypothetical protein